MAVRTVVGRRFLALAVMAALFVGLAPAPAAHALTVTQIRTRLYKKVNATRENHGLRPLRVNTKTQRWAQDHARWLSRNCKLDVTVLGCHDDLLEVRTEIPGDWRWWGENLAMASSRPRIAGVIHGLLMDSPPHCSNILRRQATHMGFGVVKYDGRVYVVQRFVDRTDWDSRLGIICT